MVAEVFRVTERSAEVMIFENHASDKPPLQVPSVPHLFCVAWTVTGKLVEVVPPVM